MKQFYVFLFFISSLSYAKLNIKYDQSEFPYEFKALLQTILIRPLQEREQVEVEIILNNLSNSLSKISKADSFALLKGELYKTLLDYPIDLKNVPKTLTWENYQIAKRKLQLNEKKLSPFFAWLFFSMLEDLQQYEADNFLQNFIKDRQSAPPRDEKEVALKRRLKFLSPWILNVAGQDPLKWERSLTPMLLDLLRKMEIVSRAMSLTTPSSATRPNAVMQVKRTADSISSSETNTQTKKSSSPDEEIPLTLTSTTEQIVKPESAPEKELNNLFDSMDEEETLTPTKVKEWSPK